MSSNLYASIARDVRMTANTVTVVLEYRFFIFQDEIYTDSAFDRSFWDRYLAEFSHVVVVARCKPLDTLPDNLHQVSDENIRFVALPFYIGPVDFIKKFLHLWLSLFSISQAKSIFILRSPGVLSFLTGTLLLLRGKNYGLEVVGNPLTVFTDSDVGPMSRISYKFFFSATLSSLVKHASAVSYVTKNALQRDFPAKANVFTTSYSSVDLPPRILFSLRKGGSRKSFHNNYFLLEA